MLRFAAVPKERHLETLWADRQTVPLAAVVAAKPERLTGKSERLVGRSGGLAARSGALPGGEDGPVVVSSSSPSEPWKTRAEHPRPASTPAMTPPIAGSNTPTA